MENLRQAIIVLHPFRGYKKGDIIRDATVIANIQSCVARSSFVVASIPSALESVEKTV